jgi:hypothetical protein
VIHLDGESPTDLEAQTKSKRTSRPFWFVFAIVVFSILAALGFSASGLQWRTNPDFKITQPAAAAHLSLPVTLKWTSPTTELIKPGTHRPGVYFAVFIDRAPLRPGQNLSTLVDDTCKRTPGCANQQYFENKFVFFTGAPHLVIPFLPQQTLHTATIVLMNQYNNRVGESFATVSFNVPVST